MNTALPAPDLSECLAMTADEFRNLWTRSWGFSEDGKPEDAASYIEGVLRAIKGSPTGPASSFNSAIGHNDGQQEFVFNWLRFAGLAARQGGSGGLWMLTPRGDEILTALESGIYYEAFDL